METTNDPNEYNLKLTVKELLEKFNYDTSIIKWTSPNEKIDITQFEIGQAGGLGQNIFHKYQIFNSETQEYNCAFFTSPSVLDLNVDLYSFYDDPLQID